MGVSNLSDGNPLSYEWLNQVADAINKLEVQNSDDSNVKFIGLVKGEDIQVLTGDEKVNIKADGVQFQIPNVKFNTPFAEAPFVIATVYTTSKSGDDSYPAAVGISNITTTEFDAVVQTFATGKALGKKGNAFRLRYVAIGKKQVTI